MCVSVPTGINQFNPMAMQNAQMSQAPMGARAPSPMNHPQQMNMSSVPTVRSFSSVSYFLFLPPLSLCFSEADSFSLSLLNLLFSEPFFSFCLHVCFAPVVQFLLIFSRSFFDSVLHVFRSS